MIRWQSHWHVVRQSWPFFQNDFAGRLSSRVLQAGQSIRGRLKRMRAAGRLPDDVALVQARFPEHPQRQPGRDRLVLLERAVALRSLRF